MAAFYQQAFEMEEIVRNDRQVLLSDGYINLGRNHWFICDEHRTKWSIGSNLFSSWREETEEDWRRNEYKYAEYVQVKPVYPEPTEEDLRQKAHYENLMQQIREEDKGYGVQEKWDALMRQLDEDEGL